MPVSYKRKNSMKKSKSSKGSKSSKLSKRVKTRKSTKPKKRLTRKSKNGSVVRKMRGGDDIIRFRHTLKNTDIIEVGDDYYEMSYQLIGEDISKNSDYIARGAGNFDNEFDLDKSKKIFKDAYALKTENTTTRNELLNKVVSLRKDSLKKTYKLFLPNGICIRTAHHSEFDVDGYKRTSKTNTIICTLPRFKIENNLLCLYKVVPKSQLDSIVSNGLDSKYGGIGGASENMLAVQIHDRGKMYVGNTISKTTMFLDRVLNPILIYIKIPIEKSEEINLSTSFSFRISNSNNIISYNEIYFIGKIEPQFLYINNDTTKELTPIITYMNNQTFGFNSNNSNKSNPYIINPLPDNE
jgi:hypothetical protein